MQRAHSKKGDLHTHSTCSDGANISWQIVDEYREKGYDFLVVTNHWVYGIHLELNRDDFFVFLGTERDLGLPGRKDQHIVTVGLPESNRILERYTFENEKDGKIFCTVIQKNWLEENSD